MASIQDILNDEEKLMQVTKAVFDSVDTDGSGEVDKAELKAAMDKVAGDAEIPLPTEEQVQGALTALD